jgi:[CysO sulfur-carrier protein]-S-L-cysteine hydrolase
MLRIEKRIVQNIALHARRELPIEACGYLAGIDGTVTVHYEMTNTDASAEHFSFNVQEQFAVLKAVRSEGLKILAVYHSHPATPSRPSDEDIALAHDPDVSYVIISLAGSSEDIRSFRIVNGNVEHEVLEVIEDEHD